MLPLSGGRSYVIDMFLIDPPGVSFTSTFVCQVRHVHEELLTCPSRERRGDGYRCERLDPHGDDHWISEHTIKHDLAGNGYPCSAIR
jgi:hypothetical protein